jgi:hypothetical protein
MNADVVAKIREEASAMIGKDRGGQVTYENNKEFKWAHAVFLETLRLHPSVPKVRSYSFRSCANRELKPQTRGYIFCYGNRMSDSLSGMKRYPTAR